MSKPFLPLARICANYSKAVTDFPCIMFIDELIAAYPDAKVILTVRDDLEAWYKSMLATQWTGNFMFGPPTTMLQKIVQRVAPKPPVWPLLNRVYTYTALRNIPSEGRDMYKTHNARVRELAERKEFLEFNTKEGWGPLCKFLDVDEPKIPFPRVNDTKAWLEYVENTKTQALLELLSKAGKACIPIVLGSIALWYWRTSS
jgi:hypothetical protein